MVRGVSVCRGKFSGKFTVSSDVAKYDFDAETVMPFGKFKGTPISEIRHDYLRWVLLNIPDLDPFLRRDIQGVLGIRQEREQQQRQQATAEKKAAEAPPLQPKVVSTWYRELAKRYHPDRSGGSTQAMQIINDAHELLKKLMQEG